MFTISTRRKFHLQFKIRGQRSLKIIFVNVLFITIYIEWYLIIIFAEEIVTLETIHSKLKHWLQKVKVIHTVYIDGVKAAEVLPSNCQKASHLLSVLFDAVMEYDDMGQCDTEMVIFWTFSLLLYHHVFST